jgi:hypothetical protein
MMAVKLVCVRLALPLIGGISEFSVKKINCSCFVSLQKECCNQER